MGGCYMLMLVGKAASLPVYLSPSVITGTFRGWVTPAWSALARDQHSFLLPTAGTVNKGLVGQNFVSISHLGTQGCDRPVEDSGDVMRHMGSGQSKFTFPCEHRAQAP